MPSLVAFEPYLSVCFLSFPFLSFPFLFFLSFPFLSFPLLSFPIENKTFHSPFPRPLPLSFFFGYSSLEKKEEKRGREGKEKREEGKGRCEGENLKRFFFLL